MKPALSIVVPMLNEADCVPQLVREVSAALSDLAHELIIVDDGSSDRTADCVQGLFASFPSLRLIRHERPHGQSTAVWSGVQAARAEWLAVLDGDLQNDPADIPRLVAMRDAHLREHRADRPLGMLIGHRVNRADNVVRRLSSHVANSVRRCLLGDDTPDTGCGLKLVNRGIFLALPYFDHMHRFMPALVQQLGYAVVSVPVNHRQRSMGCSKYGVFDRLWVGIVDLAGVGWLARRNRRAQWLESPRAVEEKAS